MATAPKLPASVKDEEIGRTKVFDPTTAKPKVKTIIVSPPSGPVKSPLFPEMYSLGLTGKGKRKTRKGKKHSRKTRKHRK